ncbi:putative bifunctional diguanylate cyclase/phosphodiesterase [Pseudoduganella sp. GCM10020061]|uniref:putative bifunctional diguanylate cyclase/phosphodiesterase n=1 Tax=Pseudoduganella sp. GCM10020061 TaxID=3317345 RepID=UPI00362AD826
MPTKPTPTLVSRLYTPLAITLAYVAGAALWITVSDRALEHILNDRGDLALAGTAKGYLFCALTGLLLYGLLKAWDAARRSATEHAQHVQERLERVLYGSNDGWWDTNVQTGERYYSQRWYEMLGYRRGELETGPDLWLSLVHPDEQQQLRERFRRDLEGDASADQFELRMRHKDGHYIPMLARFSILRDAEGRAVTVSGTNTDLTQHKAAQQRLLQAGAVFDTTREGIIVTAPDGEIQMVNRGFTAITGYPEHEVLGKEPSLLSSGRHGAAFYDEMWRSLATTGYWRGEIWNRRRNGQVYPDFLSISALRDEAGRILNYVGVYADMSGIRDAEERLDFVAHHDPLTRLPNRRMMTAQIGHLLHTAQREHLSFAVLQLDLDRFKDINESYGHALGDELLVQVADTLRHCVRQCDTVARPGGDEFWVVLEKIGQEEDAARVANDMIERLGKEWTLSNGARVRTGVSIGISLYPQHGNSTSDLLQHADAAMNLAKNEGRNCFRYFSEHLTRTARERIELETELHQAIPRGELCVHFQPQVNIASGSITGAEALVRWQHPLRGMIPPGSFIPIAETSHLICEVGQWVLNETCRQGRAWLDSGMPELTLAVNVSPRQFNTAGFTARVRQVLEETGFPAHCLELELTESALMERGERAIANLAGLRELGVRLAIDDFGTGYSSLAYLKNFPLDVLKIDRSFVKDIPQHQDDMAIASAIIDMAHTLGFRVLAEGVETSEQLEFLERQGCDCYQGFYKGKPVPAEEFLQMYSECDIRSRG